MDTLGFDPRERRPARLSSTIKNFLDRKVLLMTHATRNTTTGLDFENKVKLEE